MPYGKARVPYKLERNEVLFVELSGPTANTAEAINQAMMSLNPQTAYPGADPKSRSV
ncbi:MAG: hypothetical protein AAGF84_00955 [Planctomycetota bacterium]